MNSSASAYHVDFSSSYTSLESHLYSLKQTQTIFGLFCIHMCFFDQHRFSCGDYKWGHFRQHCNREHRTGETCGMKLIMSTIPVNTRCKLCEKIETKRRRRQRELDRINGWREASRAIVSQASQQKAQLLIEKLDREIEVIQSLRERRYRSCASEVGPAISSIDGTRNTLDDGSTIHNDAMPIRVS